MRIALNACLLQIQGLAKQLDISERQVERWLRLRKGQNKPSTLVKFCENSWRCLYYFCSFTSGVIILWDKPWLWDINRCWYVFRKYDHCLHSELSTAVSQSLFQLCQGDCVFCI